MECPAEIYYQKCDGPEQKINGSFLGHLTAESQSHFSQWKGSLNNIEIMIVKGLETLHSSAM